LTAQGGCLLATASYGLAFVYLRRFDSPLGLNPVPAATAQVCLGALIMLILTPALAIGPMRLSVAVVISVLALGAVGTGLAYVWNNNVVTAWGATNASTVTYLTPVLGVILGVAILREPLTWNEPVGAAIVIIGVAVSQGRFTRQHLSPAKPPGALRTSASHQLLRARGHLRHGLKLRDCLDDSERHQHRSPDDTGRRGHARLADVCAIQGLDRHQCRTGHDESGNGE
jgi:uncharacterized membrane protein